MKREAREMEAIRWILSSELDGNARLVLVALVVYAGVPPGSRTMPELARDTALSQGNVCLALGELVGASLVEHVSGAEYRAALARMGEFSSCSPEPSAAAVRDRGRGTASGVRSRLR